MLVDDNPLLIRNQRNTLVGNVYVAIFDDHHRPQMNWSINMIFFVE